MKFEKKVFTPTGNVQDEGGVADKVEKPFVRDDSDNKLFKEIQVKDITPIITDDCIGHFDFDTPVWKACANMENKFITVKHKEEGWEEEFKNISTFRGLGNGIKPNSWLGMKNVEREVEGLTPYSLDDFEITESARLKMEHEKTLEQAKVQIYKKLKQIRQQYRIPRIKVHIGSGDCFRHELDLVRPYKGNRNPSARPIILKEFRDWVEKELDCEVALKGYETDDRVEHFGWDGYRHYLKTGKFNHLVIASDKDAKNNAKLLVDPDTHVGENNPLKGKFKFPQAMLIKDSTRDCGDIGIVQKQNSADYKFYGFKGLLWQAFLSGDGADNYNALTHLKQNLKFGDESAYRLLKPCKSAKEALQATIDKFAELLPYGVQYVNHKGEEMDVDTMTYMETYFLVAYMTRSYKDDMTFKKLCEAMKVDTSKVVGNNKLTPPVRTFTGCESHIAELEALIKDILENNLKGLKSKKKSDQAPIIDEIKEKLESIDFECHYEMVQKEKDVTEVTKPNKKRISLIDHISKWKVENGDSPEVDLDCNEDMEIFEECLKREVVHQGTPDVHRWYNLVDFTYEVEIENEKRYFCVSEYRTTGDMSARDMDLYTTLKDVHEVFPKQVMTTIYE